MVLTLPFLAAKPAMASHYEHNLLSQIHRDVHVPTCPPLLFSSFHSISTVPPDGLFTAPHTIPIFLLPPTPPVSGLTKVSSIPKQAARGKRALGTA